MARRRSFADWLDCQRDGDDPVADLAEDARHDPRVTGATTPEDFLARAYGLPSWAVATVNEAAARRRTGAEVVRALQERALRAIDRHDRIFGPPSEDPLDVLDSPAVPTSTTVTRQVRSETLSAAQTDPIITAYPKEFS